MSKSISPFFKTEREHVHSLALAFATASEITITPPGRHPKKLADYDLDVIVKALTWLAIKEPV